MPPLVSICIPTLNGEKFLVQALRSVSEQTYKNIEVIISDDHSSDDTLKLVTKFEEEVNFPVFVYEHLPKGIGANWNNCISKANGEYIKFLFQDDVLFPDCIEKQVELLEQDKTIGLVSCKRKFLIEENPNDQIKKWIEQYENLQVGLELNNKKITILSKNLFKSDLFFQSPLNKIGEPSAVIFKKVVLKKVGTFREDLEQILDYEFYYRVLKYYKVAILNEALIGFRIHPKQATNVNRNRTIDDYEKYDKILYEDFFWYLNLPQRKRLLKKYNKTYMLGNKIINAARKRF